MDDGLIFPYRSGTDRADVRVLTHAAGRGVLPGAFGCPGGSVAGGLGVLRAGRQAC